jgi:hypothetical protein
MRENPMFITGAERRRFLMMHMYMAKGTDTLWEYMKHCRPHMQGLQLIFEFPNGHKASCVSHQMSYGGEQGLWEILETTRKGYDGMHEGWLTTPELVEKLMSIRDWED